MCLIVSFTECSHSIYEKLLLDLLWARMCLIVSLITECSHSIYEKLLLDLLWARMCLIVSLITQYMKNCYWIYFEQALWTSRLFMAVCNSPLCVVSKINCTAGVFHQNHPSGIWCMFHSKCRLINPAQYRKGRKGVDFIVSAYSVH